MPTPRQSRPYIPGPERNTDSNFVQRSEDLRAGLPRRRLDRSSHIIQTGFDNLPFFEEHERQILNPAGVTNLTSADWTPLSLTGNGQVNISRFEKYESWTEMIVEYQGSAYSTTTSNRVEVGVQVRDASNTTTVIDTLTIGRMYLNPSGTHTFFAGHRRFRDLNPGTYVLRLMWRALKSTIVLDTNDTHLFRAREVIPTGDAP